LTVGSLNLANRTITVTRQLSRDRTLAPPKSRAGIRGFSIPTEVAEVLPNHAWESGIDKPGDLLFGAPEGGPLDYSHWRWRIWVPATERAGLKGTGFHDLRRANASTLVAEGVDVKTAQSRLGHSDPRLTLAVYERAVPEADRAAAEVLGRVFFRCPRAGSDRAGAGD
jgi:integrase